MSMGSKKQQAENLYIELDCLLDTRYGVLYKHIGHKLGYVMDHGYRERFRDEFRYGDGPDDFISREEFKKLYDARDLDTLRYSVMTNMVHILIEFVQKAKLNIGSGDYSSSSIVINTYPFKVDDGLREALKEALRHRVNPAFNYRFVHMSPEELTPAYCRNEFSYMIMYEADHWMHVHTPRWPSFQMPDIVVTTPMILRGTEISDEGLVNEAKANPMTYGNEEVNPLYAAFRATQFLASHLVSLQFVETKLFSAIEIT